MPRRSCYAMAARPPQAWSGRRQRRWPQLEPPSQGLPDEARPPGDQPRRAPLRPQDGARQAHHLQLSHIPTGWKPQHALPPRRRRPLPGVPPPHQELQEPWRHLPPSGHPQEVERKGDCLADPDPSAGTAGDWRARETVVMQDEVMKIDNCRYGSKNILLIWWFKAMHHHKDSHLAILVHAP